MFLYLFFYFYKFLFISILFLCIYCFKVLNKKRFKVLNKNILNFIFNSKAFRIHIFIFVNIYINKYDILDVLFLN